LGDGVYGIRAAAQHHYDVHARQLTLDQAAMLAVLLPKPKSWDPNSPNPGMLRRQAMILRRCEAVSLPIEIDP